MSLLYVIDGYNLTNSPAFAASKKNKLSPQALIDLICLKRLIGSPKNKAIVVFDGYPSSREAPVEARANIEVIYSCDDSADTKIKNIIEKSSNPKNIAVVSDDKEIRYFIRSIGAKPVSTDEFFGYNPKDKRGRPGPKDEPRLELGYTQMHNINEELKRLWLK